MSNPFSRVTPQKIQPFVVSDSSRFEASMVPEPRSPWDRDKQERKRGMLKSVKASYIFVAKNKYDLYCILRNRRLGACIPDTARGGLELMMDHERQLAG